MHQAIFRYLVIAILLSGCTAQQLSLPEVEGQMRANTLLGSPSPYLQRHAYDPIDWHAWDGFRPQTLTQTEKPWLIVIGNAANHAAWQLQQDCFLDTLVAEVINRYFFPILVDEEEWPDLAWATKTLYRLSADERAVGPLTLICFPDGRPIFVGNSAQRQEWISVVHTYGSLYDEDPAQLDELAQALQDIWTQPESTMIPEKSGDWASMLVETHANPSHGPPFTAEAPALRFLLDYSRQDPKSAPQQLALEQLDRLADGAVYDHFSGGFFGACLDGEFRYPTFEKRLAKQALLVELYSLAFQLSSKNRYAQVVYETLEMLENEFKAGNGGYYSSLSATTEGEEGRYYLWPLIDVEAILQERSAMFARYFHLDVEGTWPKGQNLPFLTNSPKAMAVAYGLEEPEFIYQIDQMRGEMEEARQLRYPPTVDTKQIVGYNALMLSAWIAAYRAFSDEYMLKQALETADFLRLNCRSEEGGLGRYVAEDQLWGLGFLEDYAYVARAWLELYQVTQDRRWLAEAYDLVSHLIPRFYQAESQEFRFSELRMWNPWEWGDIQFQGEDLPATGAVLSSVLEDLAIYLDKPIYRQTARGVKQNLSKTGPASLLHGSWGRLTLKGEALPLELVVTPQANSGDKLQLLSHYPRPNLRLWDGSLAEELAQKSLPITEDPYLIFDRFSGEFLSPQEPDNYFSAD